MKKETKKFNRKIKKAEEQAYYKGLAVMKHQLLELIPLSAQVIDTVDAGLDVTLECKISAKELMKIIRYDME